MLKLLTGVVIFAGLPLSAQGLDAKAFVGEWQAKVKDKVICTLRLKNGNPISGQTENCRVNFDANGNLQEPESDGRPESVAEILHPKLKGSTLDFEEKDSDDVLKFEFTLVGGDKAELKILGAPVEAKPVSFHRL